MGASQENPGEIDKLRAYTSRGHVELDSMRGKLEGVRNANLELRRDMKA